MNLTNNTNLRPKTRSVILQITKLKSHIRILTTTSTKSHTRPNILHPLLIPLHKRLHSRISLLPARKPLEQIPNMLQPIPRFHPRAPISQRQHSNVLIGQPEIFLGVPVRNPEFFEAA